MSALAVPQYIYVYQVYTCKYICICSHARMLESMAAPVLMEWLRQMRPKLLTQTEATATQTADAASELRERADAALIVWCCESWADGARRSCRKLQEKSPRKHVQLFVFLIRGFLFAWHAKNGSSLPHPPCFFFDFPFEDFAQLARGPVNLETTSRSKGDVLQKALQCGELVRESG